WPLRLGEPPQRIAERSPVRVADRDVVEPRRPGRRRRSAPRLPGVEAEVMVIAAGRDERSLVAHALRHVETENVAIEGERPVDVRDLEVDVADVDARVDAHRGDDTASWKRERWIRSRPKHPPSYGPHGVEPLNAASANTPSASSTVLIFVIRNTPFPFRGRPQKRTSTQAG